MAALSVLAFGYYSQLIDPTSPVNTIRRPQHNTFNPNVNPYAPNAPYNTGYYGANSSANLNAAPSGYYPPYLGYGDPSRPNRGDSSEGFVPPAGPPPGWKGDLEAQDKAPAYESAGYGGGIGPGERDAKVFRSDAASERTVVGTGEADGKDLTEENPFDDFETTRQEVRLREHETGSSARSGRM